MVFSTSLFLLYFLPLFLLLYHLTPIKHRNVTALIGSLVFYIWGAPIFIFILIGSIVLDFYFTSQFVKQNGKKFFLVLSLILNIGLLAYFKYANFFIFNTNQILLNLGFTQLVWTKIALPIGISFFTFQKISYAVDVYQSKSNPLKSIADYALYILLFPQLIAGPIVRYNEIADQLINRRLNETFNNKLIGFYRFIIGLSKKVLIANSVGVYADFVFNSSPTDISFLTSWLGLLAYAIQIYFDFSGYSDMAIGLGKMLGFNFSENFNNPYTSRSITEFWKRWHISLSTWMRDYVYIPLGGNRSNKFKLYLNLWIVFLISGFWHGASWNFIFWGVFHGLFLSLDKLFLKKWLSKLGGFSFIITFLIVLFSWVLFRCESISHSLLFYKTLLVPDKLGLTVEFTNKVLFFLVIGVLFSFITFSRIGLRMEKFIFFKSQFSNIQHIVFSIISIILLIICVGYISGQEFNPFIYFRF
jgi:alginate O-acetyltransferase complex protein AlgI